MAISQQLPEKTQFLLSKGVNPNSWGFLPEDTLLSRAARYPSVENVNLLLEYGAQVPGSHALRLAAENGNFDVARRLLEVDADVNEVFTIGPIVDQGETDNLGTALHAAARNNRVEIAKFVLDHGADAAIKDQEGMTPS